MQTPEGLRKRLHRREREAQARYLTCSCYRGFPLFLNPAIRDVFVQQLEGARSRCEFKVYAWVVMLNHVHLLIKPKLPEFPVQRVLSGLKRMHAEVILARWRELDAPILGRLRELDGTPHFWQPGGGHDRNVWSEEELHEKRTYIHWNPVRKKLVASPPDWAWSSARWYMKG